MTASVRPRIAGPVVAGAILAAVAATALMTSARSAVGQSAPAASSVTSAGVTLRSVSIDLPNSDRSFPGGAGVETVTGNCTACHSPGMVLNQPGLTRAAWEAEVNKMRTTFKAPIAAEDVPAIVAYLTSVKGEK